MLVNIRLKVRYLSHRDYYSQWRQDFPGALMSRGVTYVITVIVTTRGRCSDVLNKHSDKLWKKQNSLLPTHVLLVYSG